MHAWVLQAQQCREGFRVLSSNEPDLPNVYQKAAAWIIPPEVVIPITPAQPPRAGGSAAEFAAGGDAGCGSGVSSLVGASRCGDGASVAPVAIGAQTPLSPFPGGRCVARLTVPPLGVW